MERADLVERQVYKVRGRNINFAVFVAPDLFIGIRFKIRSLFLDGEYHHQTNAPYGTCSAIEPLGIVVPDHIPLRTRGEGTFDEETMREVEFDKPKKDGGKGWYFVDTGEAGGDDEIHPRGRANWLLRHFMLGVEADHDEHHLLACQIAAGEKSGW